MRGILCECPLSDFESNASQFNHFLSFHHHFFSCTFRNPPAPPLPLPLLPSDSCPQAFWRESAHSTTLACCAGRRDNTARAQRGAYCSVQLVWTINERRVLRRLLQRVVGLSNNVVERIHPHFVGAQHPHILHSGVYMHHVILQAPQVKVRPTLQMPRAHLPRLFCCQPPQSTGCVQHLRPALVHHMHHGFARLRRGHGVV